MEIRELMTKGCSYLAPNTSLAQAAQKMREDDIGSLPIGENDKLIGMVTDRDIVVRGIAEGKDASATSVSEVMSDNLYYCFDDQLADDVASNMSEMQVRRLPVVDREKRLVGIVTLGDLAAKGAPAKAKKALEGISQ